ncbi:MAG TPA: phenylalanine--tRNA ligase subunit alpha [Acidimicrobiales bacterium]|nr:phenylalanine--tRNA ligase subunit alpha [Acidimicrobiales bacterium]
MNRRKPVAEVVGRTDPPSVAGLAALEAGAEKLLGGAADLAALAGVEAELVGRRSTLNSWKRALGGLPESERRTLGEAMNAARDRIESRLAARRAALEASARTGVLESDRLDLTEVLPVPGPGHLHPVTQVREELEDIFLGMGYEIAEGPEVETDWYNFTALNMPPDHPARSGQDSFYLEIGDGESVLLRTHTSPVQIHLLERGGLPIYAVIPGLVYRRDTPDASHLPIFHQIEGLVVDRGVTFGDLAGTVGTFTRAIFGADVSARLRPGYFPFTEPSAEFDISCTICQGAGCRTCAGVGFIELGGCGMVHPAVLESTGVDPEVWSGFAFGFGIDRVAIMRHGIEDMRSFLENDVRFLTGF